MNPIQPPAKPQQSPVKKIEISVDTCAQLGGAAYNLISALEALYSCSELRRLQYVDTLQGFREKSNTTNPEILGLIENPHSRYAKHLYSNASWCKIVETPECQTFSETLGNNLLPKYTQPFIDAVEKYIVVLQDKAGDKQIDFSLTHKNGRPRFSNSETKSLLFQTQKEWEGIAEEISVLDKTSPHKKVLLLEAVQEFKAIVANLLYRNHPKIVEEMGQLPEELLGKEGLLNLREIRDSAHHYGHLTIRNIENPWTIPEIQQSARYTNIWPWARKSRYTEEQREELKEAHFNCADRAAVSYFFNSLCARDDAQETLYLLVTHDGPLIEDFVKFASGVEIKQGKKKPHGNQKKTWVEQVAEAEYSARGLPIIEPDSQAKLAVLTGMEFAAYARKEIGRAIKKSNTVETKQAAEWVGDCISALEDAASKDRNAIRLMGFHQKMIAHHKGREGLEK